MEKILLISPKDVISKAIISFLEAKGESVTIADDIPEAMSHLFRDKYKLIITTLFFEDFDAVQLISSIKNSNSVNSYAKIILLTSGEQVHNVFTKDIMPDIIIQKNKDSLQKIEEFYSGINSLSTSKTRRVLYIDDDIFVQKMIKMWLGKIDFIELDVCGSLTELKTHLNNDYDIIVSDNLLMDGEFKDIIRLVESSHLKGTPVIVYSGNISKLKLKDLNSLGNVIDLLPKPFDLKTFLNKLNSLP